MSTEKNLGSTNPLNRLERIKRNVNRVAIVMLLLPLIHSALGFWTGLMHNKDGEVCRYVGKGETYHLIIQDLPCVLTTYPLKMMLVTYLMWSPLLLPAVLAWAYYRWMAK